MSRDLTAAILGALADGLDSSAAIGARLGISAERASTRLVDLVRAGRVLRTGTIAPRRGRALVRWGLPADVGPTDRAPPLSALPPLPDASAMSLTARLLGDPLPGRSALDARGAR